LAILPDKNPHCLIVGAGIAGLATAISLAQRNIRVTIVEKRDNFLEEGAGIQLGPNATRCLSQLGVTTYLRENIIAPNSLILSNLKSGDIVNKLPLGRVIRDKFSSPYWLIKRKHLHLALLEQAKTLNLISLNMSCRLIDYQEHSNGYAVLCGNNQKQQDEFSVHAIIGADGVYSDFRAETLPRKKPRFSGFIAWRGTIEKRDIPKAFQKRQVQLAFGNGCHFVGYPVQSGELYNCVLVTKNRLKNYQQEGMISSDQLLDKIGRIAPNFKSLISCCPKWTGWPLYAHLNLSLKDFEPFNAQTLIGDAAHPVLPFLAQGAALSLEDAVVLGASIDQQNEEDLPAKAFFTSAFRSYEQKRLARWKQVAKAAKNNHIPYHLYWPFSEVRDLILSLQPSYNLLKKYDWLYGFKAEEEA